MGVPKFFRWISERYPQCCQVIEKNCIPDFDNFYLDANGIIHNSVYKILSNNKSTTVGLEDIIFTAIFQQIKMLYDLIKPKKLFYIAIDGVAPRAKMNQQRARRMRAGMDLELLRMLDPDEFDSNCITPGTEFMYQLSLALGHFFRCQVAHDQSWANVTIVFSGSDTPGEGEHKIIEHIRNTFELFDESRPSHCIYGADADLIILALVSHEPKISLLREEVIYGRNVTTLREEKINFIKTKLSVGDEINNFVPSRAIQTLTSLETSENFWMFHISLLRNYISLDLSESKLDLSVIDDFVLLTFLVGNDFLPCVPSFDIRNESLDDLLRKYKKFRLEHDKVMNKGGELNVEAFLSFLKYMVKKECKFQEKFKKTSITPYQKSILVDLGHLIENSQTSLTILFDEKPFLTRVASELGVGVKYQGKEPVKAEIQMNNVVDLQLKFEKVMENYFSLPVSHNDHEMVVCYLQGLQWVLNYYYKGVPSWGWYYKYHYAPNLNEIILFDQEIDLKMPLDTPFEPFEQLMAVLPKQSYRLLPVQLQPLLIRQDSPIACFYPDEVEIDMNGKKNEWEGVVLIPFVDEYKLKHAMRYKKYTDQEAQRNKTGSTFILNYSSNRRTYLSPCKFLPTLIKSPCEEKIYKDLSWTVELASRPEEREFPCFFPDLRDSVIEYTVKMEREKVCLFNRPSKFESIIFHVSEKPQPVIENMNYVHLGWPNLIPALVTGYTDGTYIYLIQKNQPIKKTLMNAAKKAEMRQIESKERLRLAKSGICVKESLVMISLRKFERLAHNPQGHAIPIFQNIDRWYHSDLIVDENMINNQFRKWFTSQGVHTMDQMHLLPGDEVFYIGSKYYGCRGRVKNSFSRLVTVDLLVPTEQPLLFKGEELVNSDTCEYISIQDCAQACELPINIVKHLASVLYVDQSDSRRGRMKSGISIGLGFYDLTNSTRVVGYASKCSNRFKAEWSISKNASKQLIDYCRLFHSFLIKLKDIELKRHENTINIKKIVEHLNFINQDIYTRDQVFDIITSMAEYAENSLVKGFPLFPMETNFLNKETIQKLEEIMQPTRKTTIKTQANATDLLRPENYNKLNPQKSISSFFLGDLVVCLDSCGVPGLAGQEGFVVGYNKDHVEVLLGREFSMASDLFKRCSKNRGFIFKRQALLNLTRQYKSESKMQVNGKTFIFKT